MCVQPETVRAADLRPWGRDEQGLKHPVKLFGSQRISWVERAAIARNAAWIDEWKVLMSGIQGTSAAVETMFLSRPIIARPGEACTESYVVAGWFTNEKTASLYAQYLRGPAVSDVAPCKPPYRIVLEESAMRNDGTTFTDHDVHRQLRIVGINNPEGEWFKCSVKDVKAAIIALKTGEVNEESRSLDFKMRPEQMAAVDKTADYFQSFRNENHGKPPHFLWNAKCDSARHSPPINLPRKWVGAKCWC